MLTNLFFSLEPERELDKKTDCQLMLLNFNSDYISFSKLFSLGDNARTRRQSAG